MKPYEKYKDSGLNFLKKIPEKWRVQKIKFFVNIYNGDSLNDDYKNQFESYNLDDLAYISSKDIDVDTSKIQYENGLRIPKDFGKFKIAPANSTLICIEGGSAGKKIAFTNQSVHFVNKLACLNTINGESSKFLFYSLKANLFQSQFKNSIAGLIGGVSISNLKNFYLTIPSLEEQTAIANFLDHQTAIIDELIEKKTKQIALLKEKRQAIINETVTKGLDPTAKMKDSGIEWLGEIPESWEVKKLKFVYNIKKQIAGELGYNVLSVTQKGIKIRDLDNLKGQLSMDYSKYQLVEKGDFIMNQMDLLTGFIDISNWDGVTSPDYRVFHSIDKNCIDEYYLFIFQFCYYNKIFFGLGQGVSQLGRWRMPAESFNNFIVPYPSKEEQQQIVDFLIEYTKSIDETIEKQLVAIEKLKEYRQSLISEAVTGKIDVREWQSPIN